jgi:hypothetical protein
MKDKRKGTKGERRRGEDMRKERMEDKNKCEILVSHSDEYEYVFWDAAPCSLAPLKRR